VTKRVASALRLPKNLQRCNRAGLVEETTSPASGIPEHADAAGGRGPCLHVCGVMARLRKPLREPLCALDVELVGQAAEFADNVMSSPEASIGDGLAAARVALAIINITRRAATALASLEAPQPAAVPKPPPPAHLAFRLGDRCGHRAEPSTGFPKSCASGLIRVRSGTPSAQLTTQSAELRISRCRPRAL
jgi:hypothetical protein